MTTASMSAAHHDLAGARAGEWFFVWMAFVSLAICVVGFFPTYFAPMAAGAFRRPPLVHLHGATMFAWMMLFAGQTWLAATGRLRRHRRWGMLGIALATAAVLLLVANVIMDADVAATVIGPEAGARSRASALGLLAHGLLFAACVGAAIANARRPEVHKRLMLLANVIALAPALGRIVRIDFLGATRFFLLTPQQTFLMGIGVLVASEALLAAALWHDVRKRGRPHPVNLAGALIVLPAFMTLGSLGKSDLWQSAMLWIEHLAG
jgi:hypothetical protein